METVVITTKSMNAMTKDKLKTEIKSHEKCRDLINIDHVIEYFIKDLNYGWNENRQAWCLHYAEGGIMVPDPRTVHDMIDRLLSDPSTACLLATRSQVAQYVRPAHNPWIRGQWFSLAKQGEVFKHEPELAQRWRNESVTLIAR